MQTEIMPAGSPQAIPHAVDVLSNGGLVAFPTDTVYGIGALPFEVAVVDRLYVAKGRSHDKAIALLLGSADELEQVADRPNGTARRLAKAFWPGAITLIVPRHPMVPEAVSAAAYCGCADARSSRCPGFVG